MEFVGFVAVGMAVGIVQGSKKQRVVELDMVLLVVVPLDVVVMEVVINSVVLCDVMRLGGGVEVVVQFEIVVLGLAPLQYEMVEVVVQRFFLKVEEEVAPFLTVVDVEVDFLLLEVIQI